MGKKHQLRRATKIAIKVAFHVLYGKWNLWKRDKGNMEFVMFHCSFRIFEFE